MKGLLLQAHVVVRTSKFNMEISSRLLADYVKSVPHMQHDRILSLLYGHLATRKTRHQQVATSRLGTKSHLVLLW